MTNAIDRLADSLDGQERRADRALTVTVTETATIFDGPDSIYRYDLPASGITDGWAVPAVVDQVRQLYPERWPEVEVIVDATEPAAEILVRALVAKGVGAYPADALREHPLPEPAGPAERPGPLRGGEGPRPGVFHLVLVAVVLVVAALSWWAIRATTAPGADPGADGAPGVAAEPGGTGADGADGADQEAGGAGEDGTGDAEGIGGGSAGTGTGVGEQVVVHELDTVRLATPPGFRAESVDGGWILRGPDPDLRVHVAAAPLHGVAGARVLEEVSREVDADPALHPQDAAAAAPEAPEEAVAYREEPGDGSETSWLSWVAHDTQLSVGCQTRTAPAATQRAACGVVAGSLEVYAAE
ncbi:type VII secretion-associated protein [Corynebacterium sp. MSK006]|uniref:type VII secretion-associated protein n=1 Tax=Corynebacterium sp. MSK006 TaxID=3050187 RepID=UPI00254FBA99|nr:type VII secretion-associated protein [Corynebacterium sp. MSK006]MDK8895777.1 type VII secretion-associated protein [Corynebacterium sp. MSK006]